MSNQIISERKAQRLFDGMLDDCYPMVEFGSLSFLPSNVLRKMDPVAYHESFCEYVDNMVEEGTYVEGYTDHEVESAEDEE